MISSNLNVSKPVGNTLPQEALTHVTKNEKTLNKTKLAAVVLSGVAGLAAGAYSEVSLGHPKGLLVTMPLMQLARIGSEGKVKWLNHPVVAPFILGALASCGTVMSVTGMRDWWQGTLPSISWTEKGSYMAFGVSCVAAAQVVIEYSKAKHKAAVTVKKEAQNVVKGQ
jgi:hypothetical protein